MVKIGDEVRCACSPQCAIKGTVTYIHRKYVEIKYDDSEITLDTWELTQKSLNMSTIKKFLELEDEV